MKTAVIFFRSPEKEFDGEYISNAIGAFRNGGVDVENIAIIPDSDEMAFRHRMQEFKDMHDNLVIIDGENHPYELREVIAEKMDTVLVENENAKRFLDAVSANDGVEYSDNYATLPIDATVVPNVRGAYQGYILDTSDVTLTVLPANIPELKVMCEKYVIPYIKDKHGIKSKRLILKYFGDRKVLENTLDRAGRNNADIAVNLSEKCGDITVDVLFKDGYDDKLRGEFIRTVVGELKDNIYAEFDTTLGERLFDLLKLKNLKLSVAESFTGGRVVSEIIKNSGASNYVDEGLVTYSNQSKVSRLGVKEEDLSKHGAVSSMVAYEMAAGLLRGGKCDVAIATTGIAGPKSDDTEKPVGLNFIAVGMKDGVHTYRYALKGSREEITETAKNTALFLAIKKLKSI